jgi:signal transduction histidine kinase/ActR/RegA family two-component response regulator
MPQAQRMAIAPVPPKTTFFRGTIGLVLGFAILLLAGAIAIRSETSRRSSGESIRHTLRVQNELHRLFTLVEGAESGERGFLITGDEGYLAAYEEAQRNLQASLDGLGRLVADNPEQTKKFAELAPVIKERMSIISSIVEDVRAGKAQDGGDLIKAGRGKTLMDQIREKISEMVAAEERLLEAREASLASATSAVEGGVLLLVAVVLALAVFAIVQAYRQSSALASSSEALQIVDDQLMEETARREEAEAKLRQAQKLEAIGQLTGGIAHDFNNMLSVVIASLNLLKRRLARGEGGYEQFINSAVEGAERAATLTHRLLAFSRTQPLASSPTNANELVASMSELLQRTLGEHIQFKTALADELWLVEVDPTELENAILNLAVNARDAMPNGGRLTIETANCQLDETYAAAHSDAKPGQYVRLTVTDCGVGMPAEVAAQAFDPFFTTKGIGKGTGLGLSQVYGFVKQSGGSVTIYSEPGHGTAIKLYLPRYLGSVEAVSQEARQAEKCPTGKAEEVILVVEDDERARDIAVACVRELGYTALYADSASEALKILADRSEIRLLMTDVVMPGDNGRKLAKEARRRRPGLQILFMSGYTPEAITSNHGIDPGMQLLSKPFTLEQAARKIREALDRA